MTDKPESAAEPRDGEPYYIDSECENCGTELVLYQEWEAEQRDIEVEEEELWHDEWWCPNCQNGIHMDWPDKVYEELERRSDSMDG